MSTKSKAQLIKEARVLAVKVNTARAEDRVPESDHTVRLVEILDILEDMTRPVFSEYARSEGT